MTREREREKIQIRKAKNNMVYNQKLSLQIARRMRILIKQKTRN
jgi:hypothetical protein